MNTEEYDAFLKKIQLWLDLLRKRPQPKKPELPAPPIEEIVQPPVKPIKQPDVVVDNATLERIRREACITAQMDGSKESLKLIIEWEARQLMIKGLT